jgi:hypothetical protein
MKRQARRGTGRGPVVETRGVLTSRQFVAHDIGPAQRQAWNGLWQILLERTNAAEEHQYATKNPAPMGVDAGQE